MKELESLAALAFERYSKLTTGHRSDWKYLSEERKEAWMKEVIFYIEHISDRLKIKFKTPPRVNETGGAYAAGFNAGLTTERLSIINFIDMLDTEYKNQLQEYKDIRQEKKRRSRLE